MIKRFTPLGSLIAIAVQGGVSADASSNGGSPNAGEDRKWILVHFAFVVVLGASMGIVGSALGHLFHYPRLGNMLSGVLGAAGSFGYDAFLQRPSIRSRP